MNKPRYLLALDFDGNLFRTFSPSPHKMDINTAYAKSVQDILGDHGSAYFKTVGLQNKAPYELVNDIFLWHKPGQPIQEQHRQSFEDQLAKARQDMLNTAQRFFRERGHTVQQFIPELRNKGFKWNLHDPLDTITQLLIGQKLLYLMDEIGQKDEHGVVWPQPTAGVLEFFQTISTLRDDGVALDLAITSSGHEAFIEKTFGIYKLKPPSIMVTDDDVRPRKYPAEIMRRFKPGQLPLALAHQKWLKQQALLDGNNNLISIASETKKRIIVLGDDPVKDGGLAIDGRIDFGWYYEQYAQHPDDTHTLRFFNHWGVVANALKANKGLFDGRPISEVFPIGTGSELRKHDPEDLQLSSASRERR